MRSWNVDMGIPWEVGMLIKKFYEKLQGWYENSKRSCNVDMRILISTLQLFIEVAILI